MAQSTHRVEVHRISHVSAHPNADRLVTFTVHGYTCVVNKDQFKVGDLIAYIPPDSIVPDTNAYSFLGDKKPRRIKVKKIRGVLSQGLVVAAPAGSQEGDDVADILNITHYDPPSPMMTGGCTVTPPQGFRPVYDVENMYRYVKAFESDEPVWVTEKVHGANARYCFVDETMYCGSRVEWKCEDARSIWWNALKNTPTLKNMCMAMGDDVTVYGEVYGCQDLRYGLARGTCAFVGFDILKGDMWLPPHEAYAMFHMYDVPHVPVISRDMPFNFTKLIELSDGQSMIPGADHIREGIVVRPLVERTCLEFGRVALKLVSNSYLER